LTGERALLATGWGGLKADALSPNVYMLNAAPHHRLFPRMKAVVHHGGAGSTMAGLRAGKPTVICLFFGDQPFWGQVVLRAGVGPAPVPQKSLTADRLADAIQAALGPAMAARAATVGERIRAEDGTKGAVDLIEHEYATWSDHRSGGESYPASEDAVRVPERRPARRHRRRTT
jgi:sterol 3beta-glucosyltransferase